MVLYQVNRTSKQAFQVLCRQNVIKEPRRHDSKQVNITSLMMLTTSNRAEHLQRSYAELIVQLSRMCPDNVNIFLRSPHNVTVSDGKGTKKK